MKAGNHPQGFLRMLFPGVTWELAQGENKLLMSFDDGPVPGATEWLLDVLRDFGFNAAFFCQGERVKQFPGLFERIQNEGHLIGNHGYYHLDGWKTSFRAYIDNLTRGEAVTGSRLFRPPYGRISPAQYFWIKMRYPVIMWTYLAYDFDPDVSCKALSKELETYIRPGAVIGFHDAAYTGRERRQFFEESLKKIRDIFGPFQISQDRLQVQTREISNAVGEVPAH